MTKREQIGCAMLYIERALDYLTAAYYMAPVECEVQEGLAEVKEKGHAVWSELSMEYRFALGSGQVSPEEQSDIDFALRLVGDIEKGGAR